MSEYEYQTTTTESWVVMESEFDEFKPAQEGWRLVAVSNRIMYWERLKAT